MAVLLDKEGLALTLLLGILILLFGGGSYLLLMLVFFALAVAVTKYEHAAKRELGIYEHERSWENVLSNGLVPTLLVVFSGLAGPHALAAYIGSLAAISADKFGSELGVLSGKPYALPFFNPVKPGTSGAVSPLGFWMTLVGGLAIGVASIWVFDLRPAAALLVGLVGFAGAFIDSVFGILEERGVGNKATTNLICSLAGALLGYLLIPF